MAACLLVGCGSSPAVRQAKLNDPIIVVTVQSTSKKDEPQKAIVQAPKAVQEGSIDPQALQGGILGVLKSADPNNPNDVFGGVVGGVPGGLIGSGSGQGFGGLGVSGIGVGSGGLGGGGIGLGSIGTIGRGSGSGMIGLVGRGSGERVKAKLGSVVITGPLTLDVVQRHIDDHRDDIQRCHRLEQDDSGSRWGAATFRFTIEATGRVSDVQVYDSTLASRDLESCIAHTIGAFEFPPLGSGNQAMVRLPITF